MRTARRVPSFGFAFVVSLAWVSMSATSFETVQGAETQKADDSTPLGAIVPALAASVDEDERDDEKDDDGLSTWGQLGKPVKGSEDFYAFSYYAADSKGRLKKQSGFLRIPKDQEVFRDDRLRVTDLKPGERIAVFGKVVERDVPQRGGRGGAGANVSGRDLQIQMAKVVLAGSEKTVAVDEKVKVKRFPGLKWCEATVEQSKGGILVKYNSLEYRVTMDRSAPVLRRAKVERSEKVDKKLLRSGTAIFIRAKPSKTRPETKKKSDRKKSAFEVEQLVVVDKRLVKSVYPILLGQ